MSFNLSQKKCLPCEGGTSPLRGKKLANILSQLSFQLTPSAVFLENDFILAAKIELL